ncbi:MAG TPA: crosslink repair DNA glycosylase YcaQ family protein [Gaiellaceae bacterium]|jgi:hypothetical protein
MTERAVSAATARRFLVLRHLLAPPRSLPPGPASVERVFERLGAVQFDPLEVAGRNHDVTLLARIDGYRREHTDELLYVRRTLYETYNKSLNLVPTAELPLYRVTWDRFAASEHARQTFEANAELVEEVLARIREQGPLSATDFDARESIDWYWRPTNVVRAVLEALAQAGVLALARRDGNRRVYDLAERLFPPDLLAERPPELEGRRHRLLSRYRAHGLLGTASQEVWMATGTGELRRELRAELVAAGVLAPVRVEGIKSPALMLADELPLLAEAEAEVERGEPPGGRPPGVAFLAPLDPFVWDRKLLQQLHGFDYLWEVYVPAAKRRWGYYVLPVLFGDRLVGRIEPRLDRKTGTLDVLGLWFEDDFDPAAAPGFATAFADALRAHLAFGGLTKVRFPRSRRHAALVRTVKADL